MSVSSWRLSAADFGNTRGKAAPAVEGSQSAAVSAESAHDLAKKPDIQRLFRFNPRGLEGAGRSGTAGTSRPRSPSNDSAPSWWRVSARSGEATRPITAQPSPRPTYEPSQAEAAALADAGLMPLSRYLELAERNQWVIASTQSAPPLEPLSASDVYDFARDPSQEKVRPRGRRSAKQTFSNLCQWGKTMSRSVRLPGVRVPNVALVGAYALLAMAFIFVLTVVAFAQTALLNVS
jgi:hypothetical protein